MLKLRKIALLPLIMSCENNSYYLEPNQSGFMLYHNEHSSPIFHFNEPILLVNGIAGSPGQVHLVYLKQNGDLCYSIVSGSGQSQTTSLCTLDVRNNHYRQLKVFSLGNVVHIFYAYAHQAIGDLWRIEHLLWSGKSWKAFQLGEVVHERNPLYSVSVDLQQNIHLLMLTHQGRFSVVMTNRFNSAFQLWGNRADALTIPHDVIDMAALITSTNVYQLFWAAKAPQNRVIIGWARKSNINELSGTWQASTSPIHTSQSPWHSIGAQEANGTLWLLSSGTQEDLLSLASGKWTLKITQHQLPPIQLIYYQNNVPVISKWAKAKTLRAPAFTDELGISHLYPQLRPFAPEPVPIILAAPEIPAVPAVAADPHPSIQDSTPDPIQDSTPDSLEKPSCSEPTPSPLLPTLVPIDALATALNDFNNEKHSITQAFETILSKVAQTESSIEKISKQIAELQTENELNEKGFWKKWFK